MEPALPAPPDHLSVEAKLEWDRVAEELYRARILTKIDRSVLAAYCQAYGRWVKAETLLAKMAESGEVNGMITHHPESPYRYCK